MIVSNCSAHAGADSYTTPLEITKFNVKKVKGSP